MQVRKLNDDELTKFKNLLSNLDPEFLMGLYLSIFNPLKQTPLSTKQMADKIKKESLTSLGENQDQILLAFCQHLLNNTSCIFELIKHAFVRDYIKQANYSQPMPLALSTWAVSCLQKWDNSLIIRGIMIDSSEDKQHIFVQLCDQLTPLFKYRVLDWKHAAITGPCLLLFTKGLISLFDEFSLTNIGMAIGGLLICHGANQVYFNKFIGGIVLKQIGQAPDLTALYEFKFSPVKQQAENSKNPGLFKPIKPPVSPSPSPKPADQEEQYHKKKEKKKKDTDPQQEEALALLRASNIETNKINLLSFVMPDHNKQFFAYVAGNLAKELNSLLSDLSKGKSFISLDEAGIITLKGKGKGKTDIKFIGTLITENEGIAVYKFTSNKLNLSLLGSASPANTNAGPKQNKAK